MGDRTPEERLAAHLKEGVALLKQGRPAHALLHLRPVVDHEGLAASSDLADVRARALTLLAQALLDRGDAADHEEVQRRLDEAVSVDPAPHAHETTQPLRDRLADQRRTAMEAHAREQRTERLAKADIEPLLERLGDPDRKADLLVQKAQAELGAGRVEAGRAFAARAMALDEHLSLRGRVMARLTMARACPDDPSSHVLDALALADAASEFTLLGTVAKTAELLGVTMPTQEGPSTGSTP